jgi:hypothetical protein
MSEGRVHPAEFQLAVDAIRKATLDCAASFADADSVYVAAVRAGKAVPPQCFVSLVTKDSSNKHLTQLLLGKFGTAIQMTDAYKILPSSGAFEVCINARKLNQIEAGSSISTADTLLTLAIGGIIGSVLTAAAVRH